MDDINPFDQFGMAPPAAVVDTKPPPVQHQPPPPSQQQQPMMMMMGGGGMQQQALVPSNAPPAPYGGYMNMPPVAPAPMYAQPPPPTTPNGNMMYDPSAMLQQPQEQAPAAPVPDPANPFGNPAPIAPVDNPFGNPAPSVPAPVAPVDNPFETGPPAPPPSMPPVAPDGSPFPPADFSVSSNPYGAPQPPAPVDAFGGGAVVPIGAPAAGSAAGDLDALFGGMSMGGAPPASAASNMDPFGGGALGGGAPTTPTPAPAPAYDDPLAGFGDDFGFQNPAPAGAVDAGPSAAPAPAGAPGELPPGGEYYDAKIFTPTLGVMFFKPKELTDSLFLQTDKELIDSLEDRPVVSFIVEGSSARSAGVELGHVLLKVNGVDVSNPKEASRLIKEGPRPLPLLFYVPDTTVVIAEGEHMVKYDTRETNAPNSHKDWKPKYVVIGGIIAQPWMINMYRSKSEYDIAVIETQARRPVSVKVKQFSLQQARIQNDWQGPQMVKYKNQLHPWRYIVVLPVVGNPIKISSPNLTSLKPVHEGIRRYLASQGRGGGGAPTGRQPGYDAGYNNNDQQAYYAQQQQHQQQQQQYGGQNQYGGQQQYGGGYPGAGQQYPPGGAVSSGRRSHQY